MLTETKKVNTKTQKQLYEQKCREQHYFQVRHYRQLSHPSAAIFSATSPTATEATASTIAYD